MHDWDEDCPRLQRNLLRALELLEHDALSGKEPSLDAVKLWHRVTMEGLRTPDPSVAGNFRGDPANSYLACNVRVGSNFGSPYQEVAAETTSFLNLLKGKAKQLEKLLGPDKLADSDENIDAVIELAAWAHAEWVRIHPFVNGNGRTARMWANWVLIRYGLPPFVTLRPRPAGGYEKASALAMQGEVEPTVVEFREMFDDWEIPE